MSVWESNSEPHKRGSKWTSTHTKAPPQMDGWIDEWMDEWMVCVCVCLWIPNIFFMLYSCPKINHGELCTHHRLRIYIIAPKCLTYLTYIVTIVQIDPGRQLLYTWLVSPLDGRGCNQNVVVTLGYYLRRHHYFGNAIDLGPLPMVYIGKYHGGLICLPNSDLHFVEINVLFIYLLIYIMM